MRDDGASEPSAPASSMPVTTCGPVDGADSRRAAREELSRYAAAKARAAARKAATATSWNVFGAMGPSDAWLSSCCRRYDRMFESTQSIVLAAIAGASLASVAARGPWRRIVSASDPGRTPDRIV